MFDQSTLYHYFNQYIGEEGQFERNNKKYTLPIEFKRLFGTWSYKMHYIDHKDYKLGDYVGFTTYDRILKSFLRRFGLGDDKTHPQAKKLYDSAIADYSKWQTREVIKIRGLTNGEVKREGDAYKHTDAN